MKVSTKPLNSKKTRKLFDFLQTQSINVWKKDQLYTFGDKTFTFDFDVIKRKRKNGTGYRYELVSDRLIGSGAFGKVYEVEATLAIDQDTYKVKRAGADGKTRVIKVQKHNLYHPIQSVTNEYTISTIAGHLAIKEPTIDNMTSYTVMDQIPGRDLIDIMNDTWLTTKERQNLSLALLQALKIQVTDKKIIHNDIKIENIRVDFSTTPPTVTIFDFGYSELVKDLNRVMKVVGTKGYMAPEAFKLFLKKNTKIDVYSIARVISLVWNDNINLPESSGEAINFALDITMPDLFEFVDDLSENNKTIIKSTLQAMLHADYDKRLSVDEAIANFSLVDLEDIPQKEDSSAMNVIASHPEPETHESSQEKQPLLSFFFKTNDTCLTTGKNQQDSLDTTSTNPGIAPAFFYPAQKKPVLLVSEFRDDENRPVDNGSMKGY